MKKLLPIILAVIVFVGAFAFLGAGQGKQSQAVIAARDLPAGHTLVASDLQLADLPADYLPETVTSDPATLVGQTLRLDRSAGDLITPDHLGGQAIQLEADERAVAVEVTDAAGLAGLLRPGDLVGVTAVIMNGSGTYAKVVAEGLRVLYITPEFESLDPAAYQPSEEQNSGSAFSGGSPAAQRKNAGTVVLAVPTKATILAYDFAPFGVESESRLLNVLDLLPALEHAPSVELSLFIQPENAKRFVTSGVYLPDLALTPGPSPTPTETPVGWIAPGTTVTPTTTPTP